MKVSKRLTITLTPEEAESILQEFEELHIGCDDGSGCNDDVCPVLAELNDLLQGEV